MPLPATLPQPKSGVESSVTHVFDADGNEIGIYKQFETNIPVNQADIPQVLKDAVVSAEDKHFYDHGGVDVGAHGPGARRRLAERRGRAGRLDDHAAVREERVHERRTHDRAQDPRGDPRQPARSPARQGHDPVSLPVDDLLRRAASYGVGAAAQTYFRMPVSQLGLSEAALLAGVIPSPSKYSPLVDPVRGRAAAPLRARRDARAGTHHPGRARPGVAGAGLAGGQRPAAGSRDRRVPAGAADSRRSRGSRTTCTRGSRRICPVASSHACPLLDKGGLRIVTTLDPRLQQAARRRSRRRWATTISSCRCRSCRSNRRRATSRRWSVAATGRSRRSTPRSRPRQPGSSFKPFVLATAFEEGIQPSKVYSGAPLQLAGRHDDPELRRRGSSAVSTCATRRGTASTASSRGSSLDAGVDKTMAMAQRLGADMPAYDPAVYGASVALGVIDVSPLQMASAYGVFADHGKRAAADAGAAGLRPRRQADPRQHARRRSGAAGRVRRRRRQRDRRAPRRAHLRHGGRKGTRSPSRPRARRARRRTRPTPGSSGTRRRCRPRCGWDTCTAAPGPQCGMHNINGVREVTGGTIPASTWQHYMKRALDGVPVTDFNQPAPIQPPTPAPARRRPQGVRPGQPSLPVRRAGATGPYVVRRPGARGRARRRRPRRRRPPPPTPTTAATTPAPPPHPRDGPAS